MIALLLVAVAAGAAVSVRPPAALHRTHQDGRTGPQPPRRRPASRRSIPPMAVRLACFGVGGLMALAGLGPLGLIAGGAAAVVVPILLAREEPRDIRRTREALTVELPIAVGLLAATLAAGADPATCLARVADAVGGMTGERLRLVAAELRLGSAPDAAWSAAVAAGGDALGPVRDAFAASGDDGSALAARLTRLADAAIEAAGAAALAAAERVGVRAVLPLGLCFLPAFVAVGVVPVIAAALGGLQL